MYIDIDISISIHIYIYPYLYLYIIISPLLRWVLVHCLLNNISNFTFHFQLSPATNMLYNSLTPQRRSIFEKVSQN